MEKSKHGKYRKKFDKEYKRMLKEMTVSVGVPFVISVKTCPSSGQTQEWYLPPEISLVEKKYPEIKDDRVNDTRWRSLLVGGEGLEEYVFVAKKRGTFCILGEFRQQWRIAKESMLPYRHIIHVQ